VKVFKVEDYGAPSYPEVVIVTLRATLRQRRADIRAAVAAIAAGVDETLEDPDAAVAQIAEAAGAEDPALVRAQLRAVAPTWARGLRLNRGVLERWATWDAEVGIVETRPDVAQTFVFDLDGS
jgi:NitT/TauT family transport system substrate-binding protein/putative hydroxymethylpyrimidine transport system substrate-binding protein